MRKTALITGASSGLGLEFARIFARKGYDLVLVARSTDKLLALKNKLEAIYGNTVFICVQDLILADAASAIWNFTQSQGISVDVLVNNAGFGDFGAFAGCDAQKQLEMLQVNVVTLTALTRYFVAPMVARRKGRILNVASVAAFQPGPLMSVYYASKSFVLSFTEALSVELMGSGVTVTALCPGPTTTGFEQKADLGESGLFKHLHNASSKEVAEFGVRQLIKGKVIAIPGVQNKLVTLASKLAPRAIVRRAVYEIQK